MLNRAIADELTAVHPYMYSLFHRDGRGCDLLAGLFDRNPVRPMLRQI